MTPIDAQLVIRIVKSPLGRVRGMLAEVFLTTAIWCAGMENVGFVVADAPVPDPVQE